MTDKNNESALLLRMNKEEQVSVLQEIGFTSVNENTPASDIAKYIRWAGGLLDLSFATIRIEDGVNVFFTAEEWNSLSANNRSKYLRIGVRIRADRRQFVIAKSDCTDDIGGRTFKCCIQRRSSVSMARFLSSTCSFLMVRFTPMLFFQ